MTKKCIIYSRVSTDRQTTENQIIKLQEYAGNRYNVIELVQETESSRNKRIKLNKLLNRNDYDILLVYALDRISRNGMFETINIIQNLADRGIAIESFSEPMLNTENELVRNILLTVLSSFAKIERERISERTKLGLERAKKQGKKLGRPKASYSTYIKNRVSSLKKSGISLRKIAKETDLTLAKVRYILAS
jgi:DNA invertase Pin-like site-specific DNA recombinase